MQQGWRGNQSASIEQEIDPPGVILKSWDVVMDADVVDPGAGEADAVRPVALTTAPSAIPENQRRPVADGLTTLEFAVREHTEMTLRGLGSLAKA